MSSPDPPLHIPGQRSADRPASTVDLDQPFDVDGLYTLRATLSAHASHLGAAEEQVEHLLIVASELATNAIRHGGGGGRLRLWLDDGVLYCQVIDRGSGIADPMAGTTRPNPASTTGGRGLWICRALTESLVIAANPDGGTIITAVIPRPAD